MKAFVWSVKQLWFIVNKTSLFNDMKDLLTESKNVFVLVYQGIGLNGE